MSFKRMAQTKSTICNVKLVQRSNNARKLTAGMITSIANIMLRQCLRIVGLVILAKPNRQRSLHVPYAMRN